jgi:hypothetical protein
VVNWSISRNYKEIWNSTEISVTLGMYLTQGSSVQRTLTSRPKGWPAGQIPGPTSQLLCLHKKGKAKVVEKVGGGRTTWPATTW